MQQYLYMSTQCGSQSISMLYIFIYLALRVLACLRIGYCEKRQDCSKLHQGYHRINGIHTPFHPPKSKNSWTAECTWPQGSQTRDYKCPVSYCSRKSTDADGSWWRTAAYTQPLEMFPKQSSLTVWVGQMCVDSSKSAFLYNFTVTNTGYLAKNKN